MIASSCTLPNLGPGKLEVRELRGILGTEDEKRIINADNGPEASFYKNKAMDFSKAHISVDFVIANPSYADVATIGCLSRFTAGQVYYYTNYVPQVDNQRIVADLTCNLTRPTGFEAVLRVRCSQGVGINNYYGNLVVRGQDLLILPNVTNDTALNVELTIEENLPPGSLVSIQSAVLYTTFSGERRILVHTLTRPVTTQIMDMYKLAKADTLANAMAKIALDNLLRSGLTQARRYLHKTVVDIARGYRLAQAGSHGAGGLPVTGSLSRLPSMAAQQQGTQGTTQEANALLPENLAFLPLFSMGLQKSIGFRGGEHIRSDERAALVYRLLTMSVSQSKSFVYPQLYSLHDMEAEVGRPVPSGETIPEPSPYAGPVVTLPSLTNLSAANLFAGGAYLLTTGVEVYLWLGHECPPELISALFGNIDIQRVQDLSTVTLFEQMNDYSHRVMSILRTISHIQPAAPKIRVVRENARDINEARLHWHMIEDRQTFTGGNVTYHEYISAVTRECQSAAGYSA